MAFNTLGQYSGTHKTWDHVGNNVPNIEISPGVRPDFFKPAEWLPVQFYDKYYENWLVILAGKAVAFDNNGDLVPAGYGLASSPLDIVYTQNDIDAGVIDVTTGAAVTATKTVTTASVTKFLGGTDALTVSKPVGIAPYSYLQWAGGDGFNPADYRKHNYNMQHGVALLCDWYIELPLVPAKLAAAEALSNNTSASGVHTLTALANIPVAANTARTPFEFSGTDKAAFAVQVSTVSGVVSEGYWHINLDTGVITVQKAAGPPSARLQYYHYKSAPGTVSKFASAVGNLKPGDFVKVDKNSNFTLDSSATVADTLGQVLKRINVKGASLLDRVHTAYASINTDAAGSLPAYAGQMDQMPGSATGGVPDNVHYAGAADTVVRINLINR